MAAKELHGFQIFAKDFSASFIKGVNAGITTAKSPSFKRLARKYAKLFLQVFGITYFLALLIWLPIVAIVGLIDVTFKTDVGTKIPGALALMCKVSEIVGPLLLLILNWKSVAICEEFFFGQLAEINFGLAEKLQRVPIPPTTELLKAGLQRYLRFAAVALVLFIVTLLPGGPVFRSVLEAAISFYIMNQVFGYYSVSAVAAGLRMVPDELWMVTGLPITGWHVTRLVKMFFLARSVSREILDPYISRSRYALKKLPKVSGGKKPKCLEVDGIMLSTALRSDAPKFLGFSFPFALLMSFPILGPLTILFAQAAAAHLVRPMLTEESRRFK